MTDTRETLARLIAARKMGLLKDTKGERLPDDLWQQALPDADAYLAAMDHDESLKPERSSCLDY